MQPGTPDSTRNENLQAETGRGGQITLTHTDLASMLNAILYPNPDDSGDPHNPFGPYGPGGPVMEKLLWAMLNPQPLPPGPDPYRSAFFARIAIDRATAQQQFVEVLGSEQSERSIIIIGGRVRDIVDEWCGTRVPGHHGPRPHAVNLLAAAAQFQKAADSMRNNALQSVFASAAGQLFKTGISRLQGQSENHSM